MTRPWVEFHPQFRVILPNGEHAGAKAEDTLPEGEKFLQQRKRAFGAFRANVPPVVATLVENFQSRQLKLLRLMQKSPASTELASINPALFFALSNYKLFRTKFCTLDGAAIVAKRRQREIAEWIGFPATDAAARILAKIPVESVSVEYVKSLSKLIDKPEMLKVLSHLPVLNIGVKSVLTDNKVLAISKPSLLAEIANTPSERFQPRAAQMLSHLLELFVVVSPDAQCPKIASLAQLHSLHHETATEFIRIEKGENGPLPRPPISGTKNIVPILSMPELRREGKDQRNCVATFAKRIRSGSVFIFRVLTPERATLSIVKSPEGSWDIGELKCQSNTPASPATHQAVQSWLDQHAISSEP